MTTSGPLTLALVGYGQAATLFYAALLEQRDVAFRWVIGRVPERTEEFALKHGIPRFSTNLGDALDDDQVDAVIIATPHDLHFPQALQALQAGKHAVVEVPMTMNLDEARTLVQVAGEQKLVLSVPHVSRYLDINIEAKRLIESGDVGQIFQFVYRRLWLQRGIGHLFNRQRSWVDTVAWHHAAHPVDLAMWLLGEPMHCVGSIIGHDRDLGNEVDLSANFVTPSGAIVTIAMSYNAQQNYLDAVVLGENAVLEMQGFSCLKRQGIILIEPEDSLEVQGRAYGRYITAIVAGLRGEGPIPLTGAEILPAMEQLQRMHNIATQVAHKAQREETS